MTPEKLQDVRDWAAGRISSGDESPWSWYQLMKLREALDDILESYSVTTENLQQSEKQLGRHLRLVGANDQQGNVQHHQADVTVPLPM